MANHAIERINERYNKEINLTDLSKIIGGIKKNRYVFLEKKIIKERKTVLIKFENVPMKLVIDNKNNIITALPIDIEEVNKYLYYIPELKNTVNLDSMNNIKVELEQDFKKFFPKETIFIQNLSLDLAVEKNILLNIQQTTMNYVILWYKCSDNIIKYSIYARKSLLRRIRNNLLIFIENNDFSHAKYLLELGEELKKELILLIS